MVNKELEQEAIEYGRRNGKNTFSFYNTELDLENAYLDGATQSSTVKELEREVEQYRAEIKMYDDLEDPSVGDFLTFVKRLKSINPK